jgi:hypothetical protein
MSIWLTLRHLPTGLAPFASAPNAYLDCLPAFHLLTPPQTPIVTGASAFGFCMPHRFTPHLAAAQVHATSLRPSH